MKIKTVVQNSPDEFDRQVNEALEEGWLLEHRDGLVFNTPHAVYHYARLVLPDPPAEPETEPVDPFEALHQVKEFCRSVPAHTCMKNCPLFYWCDRYSGDNDPCDWDLPEVLDE